MYKVGDVFVYGSNGACQITDIKEEEILKLLAEKSLTLNGLVNKWNELNSKEKHYKEDHFEILKERIFEMIKDEKIKQSNTCKNTF